MARKRSKNKSSNPISFIKNKFTSLTDLFRSANPEDNDAFDNDDLKGVKALHSWVAIAKKEILNNVSRAVWTVKKNNSIVPFSDPMSQLFKKGSELWQLAFKSYLDYGEVFFWFGLNYGGVGFPKFIEVLPAFRMSWDTRISKFIYTDKENVQHILNDNEYIRIFDTISYNLFRENRSESLLTFLILEMSQDLEIDRQNLYALLQGAIPDGILSFEQNLNPTQVDDIKRRWNENNGRGLNNGKQKSSISVIGKGAKFTALNQDLIKYMDVKSWNRNTILALYGVPLKVVDAQAGGSALSGNDTDEQYTGFWTKTLTPLTDKFAINFQEQLLTRLNLTRLGYTCIFDKSRITELQIDQTTLEDNNRKNYFFDLKTETEARQVLGLDARADGDRTRSEIQADLKAKEAATIVSSNNGGDA